MRKPPKKGTGFRRQVAWRAQAHIARVIFRYSDRPDVLLGPLQSANKAHDALVVAACPDVYRRAWRMFREEQP